jgi:hypothetical protein
MAANRNRVRHATGRHIDAGHRPFGRDAARVDPHALRAWIATLRRRPFATLGLGSAQVRHVRDGAIGREHGGDWSDAERDEANRSARFGLDDCERIVRRERHDGDATTVGTCARRHCRRTSHEVAERA